MHRRATNLKLFIVRQGLIQADVARAARISESRLSRLATGRSAPHKGELDRLSRVLGVDADALAS
jgi:transcriptional regulator with XRE-family HTH domain